MTLLADCARWYTAVGALWLIAVMLRIAYMRVKSDGWKGPSIPTPATAIGTTMLLLALISRRLEDLGKPGDFYVVVGVIGVTLIGHGVFQSVKVQVVPPFLRRGYVAALLDARQRERDTAGVHRAH